MSRKSCSDHGKLHGSVNSQEQLLSTKCTWEHKRKRPVLSLEHDAYQIISYNISNWRLDFIFLLESKLINVCTVLWPLKNTKQEVFITTTMNCIWALDSVSLFLSFLNLGFCKTPIIIYQVWSNKACQVLNSITQLQNKIYSLTLEEKGSDFPKYLGAP